MTYSRRELYALGEPLGDSSTYRKADGGLILGGGGSSAPSVTSQTTTQDLPEWARGPAQSVLNKGEALTDINQNPYKPYGGNRIEGFTDLQNKSFEGANTMQPSQQLGQGTNLAMGAGFGGANVAGQSTVGGFQNQVGGYMNPYLQQSLAPQLAEANRNYDISGTKQQSAATQAGAFGGSREAIMAAENERNRNTGLNNIIGQGYNTAFGNAQNQYNQNLQNQLGGYGLMGQSAGQLGQLGGQEFAQNMGINALQNQYGGQQQAQGQKGLDTAYQDFLTQKNYPYQQLSYMSNLIRGTPMGMNTQSQVYQPPPSAMGQLAGLGLGAYGLSKMAEGGLAFDDGGITRALNDDGALAASMDKLTDEQLQAILQHPTTQAEFEAAQQELAMRASEDGGMMSAYNQLPQEQQQGVVQAAGGGILAFKGGGDEGEYFQDPMGAPSYEVSDDYSPFKQNVREGETYTPGLLGTLFGYNRFPKETPKNEPTYNPATATRREDYAAPAAPKPKANPKVSPKVLAGADSIAKETGVPTTSLMDEYTKMRNILKEENKGGDDLLNKLMEKSANRSKEIKDQGFGKALAEFGFQMAANASKPGARFLGSAAESSPTLSASITKTNELARAEDDNQQKLGIAMQQFKIAQRKGDNATALGWATQVRQLQQSDNQIAMMKEHYRSQAGLGAAQLAQKDRQFTSIMGAKGDAAQAQGLQAAARIADVRRKATLDFENANRRKETELIKELGPIQGKYQYNQLRKNYINDVMQTFRDQSGDATSAAGGDSAKSVFDLLND